MGFSSVVDLIGWVGIGLWVLGMEDADRAAPAEREVFRAARTRNSSRLGTLCSSSLSDGVGGAGELVRGECFALRRSSAALGLAIVVAVAATSVIDSDLRRTSSNFQ